MQLYSAKPLTLIFAIILCNCSTLDNANDPVKNFEAYGAIFERNYPSFEEKGINWQSTLDKYQAEISSSTTDLELFYILTEMIQPLNDGHVTLKARNIDTSFSAGRESRIMNELRHITGGKRKFRRMTDRTLYLNGFEPLTQIGPRFEGEKLFSYTRDSRIGYLRFFRCFSTPLLVNGSSLQKQLEPIFESFKDLDAIILEIRFNIGGSDKFSQSIAGRFIDKKRVGYLRQTRTNGKFGELKANYIRPKGQNRFLKRVFLLTNDKSASAADVLALIVSQLPNATLIGENSNGSYSDLYSKKLPNSWKVTLSNQRYFSSDMVNYEGKGTPVDIEVKNTISQIENKEDSVLIVALKLLREKQRVPGK